MKGATCRSMEVKGYPTVMFGKPPQFQAALLDDLESSGLHVPEHENSNTAQDIIGHIEKYFNLTSTAPVTPEVPKDDKVPAAGATRDPGTQEQPVGPPQLQPQPQLQPTPSQPTVPTPGTEDNGEEDEVVEEEDDDSDRADLRDIVSATVQVCPVPPG